MSANVKSAVRVLEILEFLDSTRQNSSVTEIARELGYPMSSASMLLQSLTERGYLEQDSRRMFRLTPRVTLLGSWVAPQLGPDSDVLAMMEEIGRECGAAVVLASPTMAMVRYIHVVPATKTARMHVSPGATRPLANSGFGRLFMSAMTDDEVRKVVFRHNAQKPQEAPALSLESVKKDLSIIRGAGHAVSFDQATPGAGVVAVRLLHAKAGVTMGVGIGAPSELIRTSSEVFASLIKICIGRFLDTRDHA